MANANGGPGEPVSSAERGLDENDLGPEMPQAALGVVGSTAFERDRRIGLMCKEQQEKARAAASQPQTCGVPKNDQVTALVTDLRSLFQFM